MTENDTTSKLIPSADDIEMKIAIDVSKKAFLLALPVAILLGFVMDYTAAISVFFAAAVVVMNTFIAAQIIRVCARISPAAIMAGVLGGFIVRLAIIFVIALAVKNVEIIDIKVWILSVAIGHIALFAWETNRVSFSLGEPGVKPKKK